MNTIIGYVGGHKLNEKPGIHKFTFDKETNKFTSLELVAEFEHPDYFSFNKSEDELVSIITKDNKAGLISFSIDKDYELTKIKSVIDKEAKACYVSQSEDMYFSANYGDGTVNIYKKNKKGFHPIYQIYVGEDAKCHQVFMWKQYLVVVSLGADMVQFYDPANEFGLVETILFPEGSGPRHCVFNSDSTKLYVLTELSNELFVLDVKDNLKFEVVEQLSVLNVKHPRKDNTSAAIRITKDEKYLYTSTRGEDIITVFAINEQGAEVLQHVSTHGEHPRDFILDPDEEYAFIVNRFSNNFVCLGRDKKTGLLTKKLDEIELHDSVAIIIKDMAK